MQIIKAKIVLDTHSKNLFQHGNRSKKIWWPFLRKFEICVKPTDKSTCVGDSGGPSLVCEGKNCSATTLTSFNMDQICWVL